MGALAGACENVLYGSQRDPAAGQRGRQREARQQAVDDKRQ
jgi:hypothetical protein